MHRASASGPEGAGPVPDHRQAAFRIVGAQTVVTLCLAAAVLWWRGTEAALSALVGGGICALANASFAARMFRGSRGDPRRLVRAFYAGEVMKIALTAGLFAVAITATDLDVLVMIVAYLAASMVFWFALVANDGRQGFK